MASLLVQSLSDDGRKDNCAFSLSLSPSLCRRYYLEQQLKSIKKELGMEKDEKSSLVQKFKDRIEADPPLRERASEEVMKVCALLRLLPLVSKVATKY